MSFCLDPIRAGLRRLGYLPIVFDFDRPTDRDFSETVMTLAGISRFIIADITKPKSVPLELEATVPNCMIPSLRANHRAGRKAVRNVSGPVEDTTNGCLIPLNTTV